MLGEAFIGVVCFAGEDGVAQLVVQAAAANRQTVPTQCFQGMPVAKVECLVQEFADPAREAYGATSSGFQQFVTASQEVGQTLLVLGFGEVIVGRPAVVDHDAGVVGAQDTPGRFARARGVDDVDGGVGSDQGVQPGFVAADVPAGLVQGGPGRLLHGLADRSVNRFGTPRCPQDDVRAATARQTDAEQAVQDAANLAVGHATLLVEFDDGRLGIGPQLSGSGTQGV